MKIMLTNPPGSMEADIAAVLDTEIYGDPIKVDIDERGRVDVNGIPLLFKVEPTGVPNEIELKEGQA